MKKAGSSASKSKIPRISKNTGTLESFAQALATGHEPPRALSPQDQELFRAFQSNLLSLISHELRTPLTGILNSLSVLSQEIEDNEWVRMAHQNADRLRYALSSLLDLAALESGTFHVRLRETDFSKLIQSRVEGDPSLRKRVKGIENASEESPVLADPQKLGRALDLLFQIALHKCQAEAPLQIELKSNRLELSFELNDIAAKTWDTSWSEALVSRYSGVSSSISAFGSAFGGVLRSEQDFLTRMEEGLGSELLLIHEIARLHQGRFEQKRTRDRITLLLSLPQLNSEQAVHAVLASRAYEVSTELGSVALVLFKIPSTESMKQVSAQMKQALFRSSDAVYPLPERKLIALILDDCKPSDVPLLAGRIQKSLGGSARAGEFGWGFSHCPSETPDPQQLFSKALSRLEPTDSL